MDSDPSVSPVLVTLREVQPADLDLFFQWELDPVAGWMAAFVSEDPSDRQAFNAHWERILADPAVLKRTILAGAAPVGSIVAYEFMGLPTVGYWIGREFWGRGIATRALAAFLEVAAVRPLYARVVEDNLGSLRVLQKCGFVIADRERGYAGARRSEVTEIILRLDSSEARAVG